MGFDTSYVAGATSKIVKVKAITISTGLPYTGGAYNTATISAEYVRDGAAATALTLVTATAGTYTSSGFVHAGKGVYEIGAPTAALAASADGVVFSVDGIADVLFSATRVELTGVDPRSATLVDDIVDGVWEDDNSARATADSAGAVLGEAGAGIENLAYLLEAPGLIGATGNDTTHVHLPNFAAHPNDSLNNRLLVIADASNSYAAASAWITDWVQSTALATLQSALPFTPEASTDVAAVLFNRQDITGGSGPSAADIADAVLDEATAGHTTAGTLGKAIIDIGAKTTNLPSDPADASVVAGLIAGVDSKIDTIDSNVDAILVDTGTTLDEAIAAVPNLTVEAEITALKSYSRTADETGTITGPNSGSTALGITTDATYLPIKTL